MLTPPPPSNPKKWLHNNQPYHPPSTPSPPCTPPESPYPLPTPPPKNMLNNPRQFPIHTILDHKHRQLIDPNEIKRKDTSYLCQWTTPNHITYNKWRTQRDLFPYCDAVTSRHNTKLFTQYYTKRQHKHFSNISNTYFSTEQQRDTRYVIPATTIPLAHISINECNPESDIKTNTNTIQTHFDVAHIYEDNGRHLVTIPKTRLLWLWKQYHQAKNTPHRLEPPTQPFETEIVWLYQRYKYRIPEKTHLNVPNIQYQPQY